MRLTIFCLLSCFLFFACQDDERNVETAGAAISKKIGKRITIPDSMELYVPFNNLLYDSSAIASSPLKIYTFIDVSCSSCIDNIEKWEFLSASKFAKEKVPIILICQSRDDFELFKYFCESGKVPRFQLPFFIDKGGKYFKLNTFINRSNHTVLTDQANAVILSGDPTHSDKVLNLYMKKIKSYSKD